ncbi:uncharacterized protein LOC135635626 isoform X3 [Musa acuminata AAA Group]
MNEVGDVIIDVECLTQPPEICCSGSPKMSRKALSRKGSIRMERHTGGEQEAYDALKNLVKAVPSHMEQLKQPPVPFKTLQAAQSAPNSLAFSDLGEGRTKRLNRLTTIHPRKILLVFAAITHPMRHSSASVASDSKPCGASLHQTGNAFVPDSSYQSHP